MSGVMRLADEMYTGQRKKQDVGYGTDCQHCDYQFTQGGFLLVCITEESLK